MKEKTQTNLVASKRTKNIQSCDPLVRLLFIELEKQGITLNDLEDKSTVDKYTVCQWRYRSEPTISKLRKTLNALGFELKVVRQPDMAL